MVTKYVAVYPLVDLIYEVFSAIGNPSEHKPIIDSGMNLVMKMDDDL